MVCLIVISSSQGGNSSSPNQSSSGTEGVIVNAGKAIIFTIAELNKATSNFSVACKIGQGGFGAVYKGKLKDGTIAAIKRAKKVLFVIHM
jgi:hypothetical protein